MNLTALDIVVLLLMGGGALMGAYRGFTAEMLSLFAWVAAILAVKFGHDPVTAALAGPVGTQMGAAVLAFALIFILVFVAGKLLAARMGRQMRQSVLGPVDRVLGFGFGGVKGLILSALIFLAVNLASDVWYGPSAERPEWLRASRTFPLMNASSRAIVDFVEMRAKEPEAAGE
ncbi:membrane protein required for colicin V production [Sphingomonas laterariae]|uniref:Membrane protein required for colicin V production n=1 Tax=Edaphosphingomonas laterariae TaxID=861865 RepID=A0A239BL99_9SPHN|nr:CvpA family protein [Sphingomonas laterariae]SNS07804.1 membrane protein required for colicin V production [Sphingomonas laterariae]